MTLYEARRSKGSASATSVLASPRSLRLPVGIVFVALLAIAAIALGAYLVGHRAGQAEGERRASDAERAPRQTIDPIASPGQPLVAPLQPSRSPVGPGTASSGSPGNSPLGPPPTGDPRQVGTNYFVVAGEIATDLADEMVSFCRGKGLDVVAIPSHNARSQVIALPGFARDERGTTPVKALEGKIRAVGAQWKSLGRGNGDFHDFYPKLFKGPS